MYSTAQDNQDIIRGTGTGTWRNHLTADCGAIGSPETDATTIFNWLQKYTSKRTCRLLLEQLEALFEKDAK